MDGKDKISKAHDKFFKEFFSKEKEAQIHTAFPPIIPFLIYHGKEKWKIDTHFSHLFSPHDSTLSSYIPDFTYLLCDLSHLNDDQIKGAVTLRAFLLLLKYIFHDDFRKQLYDMTYLFKELGSKATGIEYIETFLRYIISSSDKINEHDIKEIIKTLPQGGDTLMPTIAEKWIDQGIQQGLLEAIQLGLELKFGTKGVALYADISKIDDIARLRSIEKTIIIAKEIEEIKRLIKG